MGKCKYCGRETEDSNKHFNSTSFSDVDSYFRAKSNPNNYDFTCKICDKLNGYGTRNLSRALQNGDITEERFKHFAQKQIEKQRKSYKDYSSKVEMHHRLKSRAYVESLQLIGQRGFIPAIKRFFNNFTLQSLCDAERFDGNLR